MSNKDEVPAMATPYFYLTIFFILPFCVLSKNNGNMTIGTILSTDDSSWLSPSGDFTFGFHQIDGDTFLPAIWYSDIPDTILWWPSLDDVSPNTAPKGSRIMVTADQGLVIIDPKGYNLWRTHYSIGTVAYCRLEDAGNLVVTGTDGETLWQSFENVRDTLVPLQTLVTGASAMDGRATVISKRSKGDFSRGRFQLRFRSDGNLVLNTRTVDPLSYVMSYGYADTVYYSSNTNNTANPGYKVTFNSTGHMYILQRNGTKLDLLRGVRFPTPETDYYFRATLNTDGVFAWYSHPRKNKTPNSTWSVIHYLPGNICADLMGKNDSGPCGYNSICTLLNGDYPQPNCTCPRGYSFMNPSDRFSTCKPDFKLGCEKDGGFEMEQMNNTDWPLNDYDFLEPLTLDQCRNTCLDDCLCVASVYKERGCRKKRYPLSNGRKNTSTEKSTAFIKVALNDVVLCPDMQHNVRSKLRVVRVLASSLATSVLVNLAAIIYGVWFFYRRQISLGERKLPRGYNEVVCFSYAELEEATNGFKEELGRGACAVVCKGVIGKNLDGSGILVAVKKIHAMFKEAEKEFKTEVNVIGQTHHRNLVKLVGFCKEDEHHLLVYEFMSHGSLADFLFGRVRPSWVERVKVAHGVAMGLLYLHEECNTQIIHCDIKPQNILLDDYFVARISDFGLAKLLMLNQFQTHTVIRGTKGYVAPEWFRNKPVTAMVDVYSFGVVLLEIISCRRSILVDAIEDERAVLTEWAFECYVSGSLEVLVDDDKDALLDEERLERFVKVAIWCVQEDPSLRPTMRVVNRMFEGLIQVPDPPCPDPYSFSKIIGLNPSKLL